MNDVFAELAKPTLEEIESIVAQPPQQPVRSFNVSEGTEFDRNTLMRRFEVRWPLKDGLRISANVDLIVMRDSEGPGRLTPPVIRCEWGRNDVFAFEADTLLPLPTEGGDDAMAAFDRIEELIHSHLPHRLTPAQRNEPTRPIATGNAGAARSHEEGHAPIPEAPAALRTQAVSQAISRMASQLPRTIEPQTAESDVAATLYTAAKMFGVEEAQKQIGGAWRRMPPDVLRAQLLRSVEARVGQHIRDDELPEALNAADELLRLFPPEQDLLHADLAFAAMRVVAVPHEMAGNLLHLRGIPVAPAEFAVAAACRERRHYLMTSIGAEPTVRDIADLIRDYRMSGQRELALDVIERDSEAVLRQIQRSGRPGERTVAPEDAALFRHERVLTNFESATELTVALTEAERDRTYLARRLRDSEPVVREAARALLGELIRGYVMIGEWDAAQAGGAQLLSRLEDDDEVASYVVRAIDDAGSPPELHGLKDLLRGGTPPFEGGHTFGPIQA